eukprot:3641054-Amphidinium_carterae.1
MRFSCFLTLKRSFTLKWLCVKHELNNCNGCILETSLVVCGSLKQVWDWIRNSNIGGQKRCLAEGLPWAIASSPRTSRARKRKACSSLNSQTIVIDVCM